MSTLQTRIVLGSIMFVVFFGVLLFDALFSTDIGFGCLAILAGGIGLREFYAIVKKNGVSPFSISGIAAGAWMFLVYWLSLRKDALAGHHYFRQEVFLILIFWLLALQTFRYGAKDAIKNISVTIFGIFYVFFLLSFAIALRCLPHGACILITVLLISKVGDIGGYLLGRKYGKRKLAKVISPNKTIEGAFFAVTSSILIAVIFNVVPQTKIMSLPWAVLFGGVVGFSALLGDLAESLLKRDANVKDASSLMPAFGGVLDVIDCLLISMPVAYYFLILFIV